MVLGQVKWFNAKAGYGFVAVGDTDVFVHHSEIVVGKEQFRYLIEGEYVELKMTKIAGKDKWQGTEITGVAGGRVMCEVRLASSESATEYNMSREGGVVRERKPVERERKPVERERERKPVRENKEAVRESTPVEKKKTEKKQVERKSVVQQMKHTPTDALE